MSSDPVIPLSRLKVKVVGLAVMVLAGSACVSADSTKSTNASSNSGSGITVVSNADVYTLHTEQPEAEAFAYNAAGTIIAVGSKDDVLAAAGPDPTLIDAAGRFVMPGFQDSHVHVPEAGINQELCLLDPGLTLNGYGEALADCAAEQPDADWVRAAGASLFDLRDTDELPVSVLDDAVGDRPAIVLDDLGHAAWTNTAGLAEAGIGPDDADPQGGVYHRNAATGEMTGLLLENAQQPVRNAATPDAATIDAGLQVALAELARNGITMVSDAGGYWQQGHDAAWQRAYEADQLTVRAVNTLYVYPDMDTDEQLAAFEDRFSNDPTSLLQTDTAKIYLDGILDLGTAWLSEPYEAEVDPNLPNGFQYFTPEQLHTYVAELHSLGYRMSFHVIGDAAVTGALDAIEEIPDDAETVASRGHRTTHTYLVDEADEARFSTLGVIADFQVGPVSGSAPYREDLREIIGDRADGLIPIQRLSEANAAVTLSSDWDADPLSPFGIMARAVQRDRNGVVDVAAAIEMQTLGTARSLGQAELTGSIEVDKQADYIIVDQNPLETAPEDLETTEVLLTVVGGREVYRSGKLGS